MSASDKDYKFGTKNNWRRWQWNRIVERLTKPARESIVLYLAGKDDLDRREALRRGFRSENLIAIDNNLEIVKNLRSKGVVAIHGDLIDIIANWSGDPRIDVIVADFCGGLTKKCGSGLIREMAYSKGLAMRTVLSVNMLRGRDGDLPKYIKNAITPAIPYAIKHRGLLLISAIMMDLMRSVNDIFKSIENWEVLHGCRFENWFNNTFRPSCFNYKSKSVFMDSVVMVWPGDMSLDPISCRTSRDVKNKISSSKAIRSMRKNGKLREASCW